MKELRILSLIDSLIAAGAERMAVNIANGLAQAGTKSYLCPTHQAGPLVDFVDSNVEIIHINKKRSWDILAFFKLLRFVRTQKINIIHAHSSSIFWGALLKIFTPSIKLFWHDHYGLSDQLESRPKMALRIISPFIDFAFVVNEQLQNYAIRNLKIPAKQTYYLSNFPEIDFTKTDLEKPLQNRDLGPRIICLANLRPQKDHFNLLETFENVLKTYPNAQLYLVGGYFYDNYYTSIIEFIEEQKLNNNVHILGSRNDVGAILMNCDIAVLASLSEGLPVSLLEYGLAELPVICTDVGDCKKVLENGTLGAVVPKKSPEKLANAIIETIENYNEAKLKAKKLRINVLNKYSKEASINKIVAFYQESLK